MKVLWLEYKISSIGLCVLTLAPYLAALFWEVVKTLESTTYLEEESP
jgi:hypothetical protein